MRILPATALVLVLTLATGSVTLSAEPASREKPAAPPAGGSDTKKAGTDQPLRFTNEDLPRLRREDQGTRATPEGEAQAPGEAGGGEAGAGEGEESGASDLKSTVSRLEEEAIARSLAETRRRIAELEARQQHLQARLKSVQNPLLRGVTSAGEQEKEAVGGLSNEEQLTWVKEQIDATERALEEARATLTELLRR